MDHQLSILPEAESTQDLARDAAMRGEPEGFAVMALNQTAGRGRYGRHWVSPPGKNLALSVILRPRTVPSETALIGMLAGVAAAETAEGFGVRSVELKWPNDVIADGLKLAGILPEARVIGNKTDYVIIGLGMNVNSEPHGFPPELRDAATSILLLTGRATPVEQVARSFVGRMLMLCNRVRSEGVGFIPGLWEARWAHRGRRLTRDGVVGTAEGIDRDGALLLRRDDGSVVRIHSGEPVPTA